MRRKHLNESILALVLCVGITISSLPWDVVDIRAADAAELEEQPPDTLEIEETGLSAQFAEEEEPEEILEIPSTEGGNQEEEPPEEEQPPGNQPSEEEPPGAQPPQQDPPKQDPPEQDPPEQDPPEETPPPEEETKDEEFVDEPPVEEEKKQEYVTATFRVCWDDEKNLADRRGEKITDILEIYGDGVLLDNSLFEIQMLGEKWETDPGLEFYQYTISNLPLYQEDLVTPVTYSLGENEEKLKGYQELDIQRLSLVEESDREYVKPTETITLEQSENGLTSKKYFGNYLPAYEVAGSVAWDDNHQETGKRPSAEAYFAEQFTFLRNQETYPHARITYAKDETNPDQWNFTVKGFFTTDEEGNQTAYTIKPGTPESYQGDDAEILITENTEQIKVTYTLLKGAGGNDSDSEENNSENPDNENTDSENPDSENPDNENPAEDEPAEEEPVEDEFIPDPEDMIFFGELMEGIDDEILEMMELGMFWGTFENALEEARRDLGESVAFTKYSVKIDGKEYAGGDIKVTEGTSFAYEFEWKLKEGVMVKDGDFFNITIFQVPGLNIPRQLSKPAIIYVNNRNIRIGTMSMNYNQQSGQLTFSMVFSKYAEVFKEISGYKAGNGAFVKISSGGGPIIVGEATGTLEIEGRPSRPTNPGGDGVGWKPVKPPGFNNIVYAFGKGKKWNSPSDKNHTRIEWRAVMMTELQEKQNRFLEDNKALLGADGMGSISKEGLTQINKASLKETDGNYIIEDTLDENQRFVRNPGDSEHNYDWNAPFFFEVPSLVVGTSNILNGAGNILGNTVYDGNGYINNKILGNVFTEVATEDEVKAKPMSWAVVNITDSDGKRKQKLIVNIGKLGVTDIKQGLVYQGNEILDGMPYSINKKIEEATTAINKLKQGDDSPVAALNEKSNSLKVYISNQSWNTNESDSAFTQFETWYETNFNSINSSGNRVLNLSQDQINALQAINFKEHINTIANSHNELKERAEYKNWLQHFDNLVNNQALYARNHTAYLNNWNYALGRYQLTKAFYEDHQVFGFCMKYMVDAVNPAAPTFSNHIKISTTGKTYEAEDSETCNFQAGVSGKYPTGSAVFKKADSAYKTYENAGNNGLAGAEFQVYCADGTGGAWHLTINDKLLGVFADKDASENQNAYVWSHHVGDPEGDNSGIVSTENGLTTLKTDDTGLLAITGLDAAHPHYLVETKAPDGYYSNSAPIEFQINSENVLFQYVPNIARGVKITKVSSYDSHRVQGAQFELFQTKEGQPDQHLDGGFTKKTTTVKGVSTTNYWYDKNASNQTLSTFENGELKILGLPAGSYYLKETKAAPGFELSEEQMAVKYSFKLPKEPNDEFKASLVEENGFYYVKPTDSNQSTVTEISNDQKTKELTLTKIGKNNAPLPGAEFTVYKWTGTDQQWAANPEQKNLWAVVSMNASNSPYFKTSNTLNNGAIQVGQNGELAVQGIPNGHYALAETKVPAGYQGLKGWLYFDVDVSNENPVQLYWNLNHQNAIHGNRVPNELHTAALKLYKLVRGNNADLTKEFKFTITLTNALTNTDEKPVSGEFNAAWFNQDENSNVETEARTGKVTFNEEGQCEVFLAHEQGITITGLPSGAKYRVTEETDPSYNLVWHNDHGQLPEQGTVIVTASNRYKTGMLRLTKNVTGVDADREKLFEFEITMKNASGTGITGNYTYVGSGNTGITPPANGVLNLVNGVAQSTIKLKAGQHITVYGIPHNTECTVKELNSDGYTTEISVQDIHQNEDGTVEQSQITTTIGTTGKVHILDNTRGDITFNNIHTPDAGELIISKLIDSVQVDETVEFTFYLHLEDEDGKPVMGTFVTEVRKNISSEPGGESPQSEAGTIEFDEEGNVDFQLKHRDYMIIKGLPDKTKYVLTEKKADGYISSIEEKAEGVVTEDKAAVVVVTNHREEGNLIISKVVSGKGADFSKLFTFNIKLKKADGYPVTGTYSYAGSTIESAGNVEVPANGTLTFDDEGKAEISLKHGQRIVISGLAKGILYTVTEQEDEQYEVGSIGASAEIDNNVEANARFTNRFKTGELIVSKRVISGDTQKAFTFTVTLDDETINGQYGEIIFVNGVAQFTLKDGESKRAAELPAGVGYEITETDHDGYTVTAKNDTGVIEDEVIIEVLFTNILTDAPDTGITDSRNGAGILLGIGFGAGLILLFLALLQKRRI